MGQTATVERLSGMSLNDNELRTQLTTLLEGRGAHASFDQAVEKFPTHLRGERPDTVPYSAWQLVEHLRIAQRDLLDYSQIENGRYRERKWPEDYWPKSQQPTSETAWDESIAAILKDREALVALANNGDLTKPFPWEKNHNVLRQILLAADHMAYHTGEIILLRRLLGCWPAK